MAQLFVGVVVVRRIFLWLLQRCAALGLLRHFERLRFFSTGDCVCRPSACLAARSTYSSGSSNLLFGRRENSVKRSARAARSVFSSRRTSTSRFSAAAEWGPCLS